MITPKLKKKKKKRSADLQLVKAVALCSSFIFLHFFQFYKMADKIYNRTDGNRYNDNLDYKVDGDVIVDSVTEYGKENNSGHNAYYRSEKVAVKAAF